MGAYIKPTSSHIRTNQRPRLCITKLKERIRALLLLLLAVQIQHGQVDIVEQLGIVLYTITAREKHDNLLPREAFQEAE